MNNQKEARENTLELHREFQRLLDDEKEQGDLGVISEIQRNREGHLWKVHQGLLSKWHIQR